jgi:hypothetical protein
MKVNQLITMAVGSLIIVPAMIIMPPSQDAWAFGGIIRALQKLTNGLTKELTQELTKDTGALAAHAYRHVSPEVTQTVITRLGTKLTVQHLEDIKTFFKDSPRLEPPARDSEYSRLPVPRSVDLRPFAGPIRSQGVDGYCTAFAIAAAMEVSIAIKHGRSVQLSERHIWSYYREPSLFDAFKTLPGKWIAPLDVWPYESQHPKKQTTTRGAVLGGQPEGFSLTTATDALKILATHKPIILALEVTESFERRPSKGQPDDGLIPVNPTQKSEPPTGAHAVTVLGYKIDGHFDGGGYFIFRNSWGSKWGTQGYGYLPFAWCKRYICAAYTLKDITWDEGTRTITVGPNDAS